MAEDFRKLAGVGLGDLARELQDGPSTYKKSIMTPIDPATPASADPRSPMAPPYADDNVNVDLVQQGLDEAEDETRDAVADAYEASARLSDEPLESLDDIDFNEAEGISSPPELAAIHEDFAANDDEGEEE